MQRHFHHGLLGLRFDEYRFIVTGRQLQPRLGLAWSLLGGQTVVRASYNRKLPNAAKRKPAAVQL